MKRRIKNKKLKQAMRKMVKELMKCENVGVLKLRNGILITYRHAKIDYDCTCGEQPEATIYAHNISIL